VDLHVLYHFSEDPTIERFVPHVPRTNPDHAPAVWAIDAVHAPLYWFPRDCPRVAVWPLTGGDEQFARAFDTSAHRLHAIEARWLPTMQTTSVYRYTLNAASFRPWAPADGQFTSDREIAPRSVEPVGDLLDAHAAAGIELRVVSSLWPLRDLAVEPRSVMSWDFSIVRMANATPRADG
jgi:hypothetical protein